MTSYIVFAAILFAISFSLMIYFPRLLPLKLSTVAILFAIANLIYFGFDSIKGWPATDHLPKKGQLIWGTVQEPNEDNPGAIYLWIISDQEELSWYQKIVTYDPQEPAPRAYKIKYNKKTASRLQEAKQAMEQGFSVELNPSEGETGEGEATGKDEAKPDEAAGGERGSAVEEEMPRFDLVDPRESMGKGQ